MKKNILLAVLFSAFSAVSAFAQSSTESQTPSGGNLPETKISKLDNPEAHRNGSKLNSEGEVAPNGNGEQSTKQRNVATTPPVNTVNPSSPVNKGREAHSLSQPASKKRTPAAPAAPVKSEQANPR
jgi:hypothetical protein